MSLFNHFQDKLDQAQSQANQTGSEVKQLTKNYEDKADEADRALREKQELDRETRRSGGAK
jgi:hypothetical protein